MLDHRVHEAPPQAILELRMGGEQPMLVSRPTIAASFGFGTTAFGSVHDCLAGAFRPPERSGTGWHAFLSIVFIFFRILCDV